MGKTSYSKFIVLLILCITPALQCTAQCSITFERNAPRDGDCVRKMQVDVISCGERGKGTVWTIQEPEDTKEYTQDFSVRNDSIVCREHNTNYSYMTCNDSIVLAGFRNRITRMDYVKPPVILMNGMAYGDSISSEFMAKGRYCDRLAIGLWGRSYAVADAEGTIVCGKDTLGNVLRLHHRREFRRISDINTLPDTMFTDTYLRNAIDSLPHDNVREDRYVWYRPGSRYPVMETVYTSHVHNGSVCNETSTSFLYLPEEQRSSLNTDLANERLSAKASHDKSSTADGKHNGMDWTDDGDSPVMMNAVMGSDGMTLRLTYRQTRHGTLNLVACDASGRPVGSASYTHGAGSFTETVALRSIPEGNVVVMHMDFNGQQSSAKITLN